MEAQDKINRKKSSAFSLLANLKMPLGSAALPKINEKSLPFKVLSVYLCFYCPLSV